MSEHKCQFCGKECKNPQAKEIHEKWCEKNPDSLRYKAKAQDAPKSKSPTLPPDEKKKDIPETPPPEKKDKPKTEMPNLSLLAPILRSFGITDGASLIKAIDDKARQMPFYNEIVNEMNQTKRQVEELNGIIAETSQKIDALINQLQQAQAQAQQAQANTGNGSSPEAKGQPQIQSAQPTAGGAGSLERWADRLLQLLQIGASSGNPSPPPPEEKYKDLITFSNVLKTLQGNPEDRLRQDLKLFVDIARVFSGKKAPELPEETPKPRIEGSLEE